MPDSPLISVILLCFNQERFVAEAIDGVLAQTYSPLEIVVIDDASTDATAQVIRGKLAGHPNGHNVTFVRNPRNMDGNASCRIGLEMTKGSFVLISAGDDIMLPEMISEMAKVWLVENVSLVTANAYYIDEHSNPLDRTYRDPASSGDDSFETLARDGSNACCFGPSIGFERDIYTTFGWPPRYLNAYDIMVPFYAYLLKGARFIEKPMLKYRIHGQNTSLSLIAEKLDCGARMVALERIFSGHLAHAVLMLEKLSHLAEEMPDRYARLANQIMPLVTIQTVEMAKKLVKVRIEIEDARQDAPRGSFPTGARPSAGP